VDGELRLLTGVYILNEAAVYYTTKVPAGPGCLSYTREKGKQKRVGKSSRKYTERERERERESSQKMALHACAPAIFEQLERRTSPFSMIHASLLREEITSCIAIMRLAFST
jgi:hypothetical protein